MIETDFEAAKKDMAAMTAADYEVGAPEEELLDAANFVFRHGALGDFLDEQSLTRLQFWVGPTGAAFTLIGHWSVSRNDPVEGQLDDNFLAHCAQCKVCEFLEGADDLRLLFEFETCNACGGGVAAHAVATDPTSGSLYKVCVGQWQRAEPAVVDAGNVSFRTQVGSAYSATWWAPLADGSFAVVIRTYFVSHHEGRDNLERIDTYGLATDPAGADRIERDNWNMVDLDSDNPQGEDLVQMATDSYAPEPGEWQEHGPESDNFAVPAHA
jgi:hypothetical protein